MTRYNEPKADRRQLASPSEKPARQCQRPSDFELRTSYRLLNSTRIPPWMLLITPLMQLSSAESSPA